MAMEAKQLKFTGGTTGNLLEIQADDTISEVTPAGGGGGSAALSWDFSTTTTDADPGANTFRMNNATPASVTELYVDDLAKSGVDAGTVLSSLLAGDKIYIQQLDTAANFILLTVVSVTDVTGYFRIVVTVDDSGTIFGSAEECGFILQTGVNATGINVDAACKGWVKLDGIGSISILASFNVSSLTDNGTGDYTTNWDVAFDSADYAVSFGSSADGLGSGSTFATRVDGTGQTAGSVRTKTSQTGSFTAEATFVWVTAFGDNQVTVGGVAPGVKVDSLCKGWVNFTGTGTITIQDSFNTSSLTDLGSGYYQANWDVDFDNADYTAVGSSGARDAIMDQGTVSAQTIQTANGGANLDVPRVSIIAFGDNSIALSTEPDSSSLSKGWINFDGTGTIAINKSFNVSSIVDEGTGEYTINWNIDFLDADYSVGGMCDLADVRVLNAASILAGSVRIATLTSGSTTDSDLIMLQAFGDR